MEDWWVPLALVSSRLAWPLPTMDWSTELGAELAGDVIGCQAGRDRGCLAALAFAGDYDALDAVDDAGLGLAMAVVAEIHVGDGRGPGAAYAMGRQRNR